MFGQQVRPVLFLAAGAALVAAVVNTSAIAEGLSVQAQRAPQAIVLDGNTKDWVSVPVTQIPLRGSGGVDMVDFRVVIRDDMIYVLAEWDDASENILHKPYKWNEAASRYEKTNEKEDRLAISIELSGNFTTNKMDGTEFEADIWHWKANRSNSVGIAHDKWWKVSKMPFDSAEERDSASGEAIYLARRSDAGPKLYRATKYVAKQAEVMPRYIINQSPKGSIADIQAKGVWADGRWQLELARKLNTGHSDDAVIPINGAIKFAIAAFNGVDSEQHSVSEIIVLKTGAAS